MPEAKLVVLNEQPDAIDHPKSELQHHIQLDLFDFRHYYSTIDLNENLIIKNEIIGCNLVWIKYMKEVVASCTILKDSIRTSSPFELTHLVQYSEGLFQKIYDKKFLGFLRDIFV